MFCQETPKPQGGERPVTLNVREEIMLLSELNINDNVS